MGFRGVHGRAARGLLLAALGLPLLPERGMALQAADSSSTRAGPEAQGRQAAAPPGWLETPAWGAALTPAQIARQALAAVVEVVTYRESGEKLGGGSGFLVSPEGLVLTSHHVLERAARAEVVLHSGEVFEVVHVAAADDRRDLAVLRIAGFALPVVRLGDSRQAAVGDPIVVIGSPLGFSNTVSHGLLSGIREVEGRRLLQVSAPISSGSSGGPVFDAHGRAIGVLAGFMRRGQNVSFAVPIEYARGLLDLPEHAFTVEAVGRKRVDLLGVERSRSPGLSLQAVLRGEAVPGEEETPWARQPRRVDGERVRANPAASARELAGQWELRELSRVPRNRSGVYRGVLLPQGAALGGAFFGALLGDPGFDVAFRGDQVRDFQGALEAIGRVTLRGDHGCRYFLHAAADAMTGVYECVEGGEVYDLGAVELRRIEGDGPSGVYAVAEGLALGSRPRSGRGVLAVHALPDGRWVGGLAMEDGGGRVVHLRDGRWTEDGRLSARLRAAAGPPVAGSFSPREVELRYPAGGRDYRVEATLVGRRLEEVSSAEAAPRP